MSVPLGLDPPTLANGTVNTAYSQTLQGTNGSNSYTNYAITVGTLPPGLTINAVSGIISGTPTTAGTYNFTGTVTDSAASVASVAYTVVISAAYQGGTSHSVPIAPQTIFFPKDHRGCPKEIEWPEMSGVKWIWTRVVDGKCYYERKYKKW